jgi:hypothetical protein
MIQGIISGGTNSIHLGSHKSIVGKDSKSGLSGLGILVHIQTNKKKIILAEVGIDDPLTVC